MRLNIRKASQTHLHQWSAYRRVWVPRTTSESAFHKSLLCRSFDKYQFADRSFQLSQMCLSFPFLVKGWVAYNDFHSSDDAIHTGNSFAHLFHFPLTPVFFSGSILCALVVGAEILCASRTKIHLLGAVLMWWPGSWWQHPLFDSTLIQCVFIIIIIDYLLASSLILHWSSVYLLVSSLIIY